MDNSTTGGFSQYQGGMGLRRTRLRIAASCLVVVALSLGVLATACKAPVEPCSVCNKSTTYCLVHMGSPDWNPQIVCKPIPNSCTACDCVIKADFPAAPPQCSIDSTGLITVTPSNDC
jgi:hypothetical protein